MIIAVVAMIALAVLTAGIANAGWAATSIGGFELFAAGSISAKILAGAVGIIGALAIAALTKPPTSKKIDDTGQSPEASSADGNILAANGPVPRVIGTRKIFPPMACEPIVDLIGEDEYVEALYILNGPHQIEDIRSGDAAIDDDAAIEYQVREGWPSDDIQTISTRIGKTTATNMELKPHALAANSSFNLANQTRPDLAVPQWTRISTRQSPDHVALHLLWPGGLIYTQDPTTYYIFMPMRIRIREKGTTTWVNLPEMHFRGQNRQLAQRAQVILHWETIENVSPSIDAWTKSGFVGVNTRVPGQDVLTPVDPTYQWEAHSHFYAGSGARFLWGPNSYASGVRNIRVDANGAAIRDSGLFGLTAYDDGTQIRNCVHVYLDPNVFPKGVYEIEVMRGGIYSNTFDFSIYSDGGYVRNFFKYYEASGSLRLHYAMTGISDSCMLARAISIWDELPLPTNTFAVIALRARNKQISAVSCQASGYVKDWDGPGWNTWTTTSNPAPHYRDILTGRQNPDPLPETLIDDAALVAWRTHCTDNDYTCDYIAEGARTEEVLDIVAACGYARPYWSEKWGVIQDYDRSAESPVQVFTHRNMRGFKFAKGFPRLPDGLLISYRSDEENSRTQQVAVYRNGEIVADGRLEQANYEGLIERDKVEQRGAFDLAQAQLRGTFYSWESPAEAIVCRRGSLVAVQSDVLTRFAGHARIVKTFVSGGNITAIQIDADLVMKNSGGVETIAEVSTVEEVADVGLTMACAIRRVTGETTIHALQNVEGMSDVLTFTSPIANDTTSGGPRDPATIPEITSGCLVTIGPLGQEYRRMIISQMIPGQDMTFQMTAVDEAPELWA